MVLAGLLLAAPRADAMDQPADSLSVVRELYLAAVQDESAIPKGLRAIQLMRAGGAAPPGSATSGLLSAYQGALITLRAKHGAWPPSRLRHVREGLAVLDRAVRLHPDRTEIRYLRLLSCYHLPGALGRADSVQEDFAALARLLPHDRDASPHHVYTTMLRFTLENGGLPARQRQRLAKALADAGSG